MLTKRAGIFIASIAAICIVVVTPILIFPDSNPPKAQAFDRLLDKTAYGPEYKSSDSDPSKEVEKIIDKYQSNLCSIHEQQIGKFLTYEQFGDYIPEIILKDGEKERNLGLGNYARLSPDGSQVVYADRNAIWVMDSDGGDRRQLTHPWKGAEDSFPIWSPDSASIGFVRKITFNWPDVVASEIYVVSVEQGDVYRISTTREYTASPDFVISQQFETYYYKHPLVIVYHVANIDGAWSTVVTRLDQGFTEASAKHFPLGNDDKILAILGQYLILRDGFGDEGLYIHDLNSDTKTSVQYLCKDGL